MKTKTLLLTAAAALLVPAAVLAPQATAGPAPAAKAPTYKVNTFERPAAGNGYPLGQWATDGWTAPWQQGMETRARIDNTTPAHGGSKSLRI
ncbi:hypothetical protein G3M53_52530, partial [Streptomyces sp. SID7982]|nr:hypothetical protein [Streptomyces sp. SID7982]